MIYHCATIITEISTLMIICVICIWSY